jgi:hypothetical protein
VLFFAVVAVWQCVGREGVQEQLEVEGRKRVGGWTWKTMAGSEKKIFFLFGLFLHCPEILSLAGEGEERRDRGWMMANTQTHWYMFLFYFYAAG